MEPAVGGSGEPHHIVSGVNALMRGDRTRPICACAVATILVHSNLTTPHLASKMPHQMAKKPLTITEFARMGGKARAKKLTPERRSEIARKAVAAREAKRNGPRGGSK